MTLVIHPDLLLVSGSSALGGGIDVRIAKARSGKTQRSADRVLPIRQFDLKLFWLRKADTAIFEAFWLSVLGPTTPFYWINNDITARTATGQLLPAGTTTTSTGPYTIPLISTGTTPVVKKNGSTAAGTYIQGSTTQGSATTTPVLDTFTFTSAPSNGDVMTVSYLSGREAIVCRFLDPTYKKAPSDETMDGEIQYQLSYTLVEELQ